MQSILCIMPKSSMLMWFSYLQPTTYSMMRNTSRTVQSSKRAFSSLIKVNDPNLRLFHEVISSSQEEDLLKFLKPILARKRYEGMQILCEITRHIVLIVGIFFVIGNHWDDVIQQYKELELTNYKICESVQCILNEIQSKISKVMAEDVVFLPPHVIDLSAEGSIGEYATQLRVPHFIQNHHRLMVT